MDDEQCHTQTHPKLVRKQAPLATRSSSLMRVSAAEHHTAEQYFTTGRTKHRKHLSRNVRSWKTARISLRYKLSLWKAALETERRCFSNVILEWNVTNWWRSSDSFSTVPPIVNGCIGDALCVAWNYHIIYSLTRTKFNSPKVTILSWVVGGTCGAEKHQLELVRFTKLLPTE